MIGGAREWKKLNNTGLEVLIQELIERIKNLNVQELV